MDLWHWSLTFTRAYKSLADCRVIVKGIIFLGSVYKLYLYMCAWAQSGLLIKIKYYWILLVACLHASKNKISYFLWKKMCFFWDLIYILKIFFFCKWSSSDDGMFEAEKPQMKVIIYCFDSTVGPFRFMGDTFLTFTPIKEALLLCKY